MSIRRSIHAFASILLAGLLLAPAPAAMAADGPITVKVNMARILRINAPAATVIVGNPGVADVTIQDPQTLILTGKSYGQTNLIVLDSIGNPIADTTLEVVEATANVMTVFMGASRTTLACAPACQPTIALGDDPAFSSGALASSNLVETMAQ
jgi:Flp pilus assembly secretin CpaC